MQNSKLWSNSELGWSSRSYNSPVYCKHFCC